jgi:signal transduction histidine kinase
MRSRGGLTQRLLVASAALAVVVAGGFAVMLLALDDLRDDDRRARRSQDLTVAANQLERLLLDAKTDPASARAQFPRRARALLGLVNGDVAAARRARAIVRSERAYIEGDAAAGRPVEALRAAFDRLIGPLQRESARSSARSQSAEDRAQAAAVVGLGGSLLLIALFGAYLRRTIVRPVSQAATMAGQLAAGDLSVRMPERGAGEIGALQRAFNTMGRSLERGRDELRGSRARIVATADETRRRIERDLHDGAQQHLVSLALQLRAAQATVPERLTELDAELAGVAAGLSDVQEELRELARGIHPAILAEGGLGPALRALARRSKLPVQVDVGTARRLPEPLEVGAYYVVSEALTNVAKHARASAVGVEVDVDDDMLRVRVRDDGVGGAELGRGSGLIGLKDRVEALGGRVTLESPPGAGTTLSAELPISA